MATYADTKEQPGCQPSDRIYPAERPYYENSWGNFSRFRGEKGGLVRL